jgi:TolA-binding protein
MSNHYSYKIEELQEELRALDAEIEQLKAEFQKAKEWNQLSEIQIKNLQNIVEAQSELLARAADALANVLPCSSGGSKITILSLIAELRFQSTQYPP